jgi:long-chain acyl-CoA synthetase
VNAKIWLKHYDEEVPHTLHPYPKGTLLDVVSETAQRRPAHPALLFKGAQISCAELEQLSDAFAAALVALGVSKGDRVALLLPNCPQFVIGQLGAWKAGAIVVPVNPLYTESELLHILADCGADTVLTLTPFYAKIKAVQPHTSVRRVIATNIKEYLPLHLRVLFSAFKEKKEGHRITLKPEDLWLSHLLRTYAQGPQPDVPVGPNDPALFLYTGGTTGTPKAAVGTHQALLMTARQLRTWFGELLNDWEDVAMANMPFFHAYGNLGTLVAGLLGRNPLALVPNPRDLDDLLDTIGKVRPALLPGVPTLFIALLHHPRVRAGQVDFKSLKLCFSAAAPLMAETKHRFETLTGGRIVEGYALTESMVAAVISPVQGAHKQGSVGMPLPDVEVRIVDAEDGHKVLRPGQVGEIVMRAPQLMQGYWGRPAESAEMIREGPWPGSGERWLYTGDLGIMDEDGYLFIVDRKKDLIKPSGFQVWPREVEEVIASHPAVAEVGVAGVPDRVRGEAVKAWVVLRDGQQVTPSEIRAYCRARLIDYKVPRCVEFRDSLPKTIVGKVLRRELVREEVSGHGSPPPIQPQGEKRTAYQPPVVVPVHDPAVG